MERGNSSGPFCPYPTPTQPSPAQPRPWRRGLPRTAPGPLSGAPIAPARAQGAHRLRGAQLAPSAPEQPSARAGGWVGRGPRLLLPASCLFPPPIPSPGSAVARRVPGVQDGEGAGQRAMSKGAPGSCFFFLLPPGPLAAWSSAPRAGETKPGQPRALRGSGELFCSAAAAAVAPLQLQLPSAPEASPGRTPSGASQLLLLRRLFPLPEPGPPSPPPPPPRKERRGPLVLPSAQLGGRGDARIPGDASLPALALCFWAGDASPRALLGEGGEGFAWGRLSSVEEEGPLGFPSPPWGSHVI